jgi:hypothetical protein
MDPVEAADVRDIEMAAITPNLTPISCDAKSGLDKNSNVQNFALLVSADPIP